METPFASDQYHAITVSGRVASGATTLSKALRETLGWKLINGGEVYREYVKKKGLPLEQTGLISDEYHRELDRFIREKLEKEKHLIVESWLAGFDAQKLNGVYKIFVTCHVDNVRVDRLVNRENMSVEEAKHHLKTREEENLKKWEKLYHTRDIWNPKLYDLTIDTYTHGPFEALHIVLQALGYKNPHNGEETNVRL